MCVAGIFLSVVDCILQHDGVGEAVQSGAFLPGSPKIAASLCIQNVLDLNQIIPQLDLCPGIGQLCSQGEGIDIGQLPM